MTTERRNTKGDRVPTTKAKPPTERYVVVTTEHRGVFFGAIDGQDDTATTIKLTEAQMCVYWAPDVDERSGSHCERDQSEAVG